MSDDPPRLDLIQRYAQRLGKIEPHVAHFTPPEAAHEPVQMIRPNDRPSDRKSPLIIDFDRLEKLGFIRPGSDRKTVLLDQFQMIKQPLIQAAFSAPEDHSNALLVTSARPGEGKSFVALNLALSIAAEHDLHVVLIDGDFYHPSLPELLGVTAPRGLVDVLLDETMTISDVLLPTTIGRLSLLPAGPQRPHSTELLASQRMANLMRDMATRYADRVIIIDAPPVLPTTEAGVLAAHVGQIVLVVEQNQTGWRLVQRSLTRLAACRRINFVLNKVGPDWGDRWDGNFAGSYH